MTHQNNKRLPALGLIVMMGLGSQVLGTQALADRVQIPVGQQQGALTEEQLPQNGIKKSQVEERFGEPVERREAVGEPPISSWVYEDYVVYFEGDRVLRSVLQHTPND